MTLLLRLVGPMQSWGSRSRFDSRDTNLEPTKSGVLGMIAAALGRHRNEAITDLAALRFGVRADREGAFDIDFHTVQDVYQSDGGAKPVVTYRHYLAD